MSAKRSRVREKGDQLYLPVERIGIAVGKKEREWRRPFAALPHEVYAEVVNLRSVVCKLVEILFRVAPVVAASRARSSGTPDESGSLRTRHVVSIRAVDGSSL